MAATGVAGEKERRLARGVSPVAGPSGQPTEVGIVVPKEQMEIDRRI